MISVVLPIDITANGYNSFTDEEKTEAIKQNFKFLLLTRPTEYTMNAEFGVGLPNYLFHLDSAFPEEELTARIYAQTAQFMPYVQIKEITYSLEGRDNNAIGLTLKFSISDSAYTEVLSLTITP